MLKIAVFGVGRGGEAVAKYLSTELNTVEIIEVIDWSSPKGTYESPQKMYRAVCRFLSPYINKVDLVILADYTLSLVVNSLREKWPEQKIIGMEVDFHHIPKSCQHANVVTLLTNGTLLQTELGRRISRRLSYADVIISDCSGWEELIDGGYMSRDLLRAKLSEVLVLADDHIPESRPQECDLALEINLRTEIIKFLSRTRSVPRSRLALAGVGGVVEWSSNSFDRRMAWQGSRTKREARPTEVAYLLSAHLWNIEQELRDLFGYKVTVIDFKRKLLHDTCLALKLRGVDGKLGE